MRLHLSRSPDSRECSQQWQGRGTPTPLCSRTREKGDAGSHHHSTQAALRAQHGIATRDGTPELITSPRGAPGKHFLLFTACSAQWTGAWDILEGLQVVRRGLGTARSKAERQGWASSTAPSHLQSPTVKREEQAVPQPGVREPRAALLPPGSPGTAPRLPRKGNWL